MNKRCLMFLFSIFYLFITPLSSFAWKLPMAVTTVTEDGSKVYNKLVIGIETGATDGFDNIWDTQALVSNFDTNTVSGSPLILKAYLKNESEGKEELRQLWKDIRGTAPNGSTTTWDIIVESVPAGKSVVISWDIPQGVLSKGERLMLKDNGKPGADKMPVQMDITQTSEYSFVSGEGETRSLSLTLTKPKSSHSKSSSGFGCGTIKKRNDVSDNGNGSADASAILLLFSPVLISRFIRLTRLRLSI